ncbi:MAG: bifunctional D-glycero-beta-D-manno-heptose-7-phosphate kinase/D-glycero-beta-D-manno-heptose 1-phosphate adenylyltransferase HldE [Betaproteobacteria bacterium]|nr:bifunctional D-glycero-beta-D-manno-heptose-7-phosphate kinase/D-glycero-beta-D-manno-heptose 1-phosphate adenylyltransferase HldE [Betaproteobacteria bacterium]
MPNVLPDFSHARLLIVGDVMLDSYWYGPTGRISPEAPVPVVHVNKEEVRLGGAGNVAANTAALGVKTVLMGLVGEDEPANHMQQLLSERVIDAHLQTVKGSKTITKLRIISRQQQLIRLDFEDHFPQWQADAFLQTYQAQLAHVDAVILSDYAKGALRCAADMVKLARAAGKPVIIDTKGTDFERYRGATLITPNMGEFEAVVGHCASDADIEAKGQQLRASLDLEAVLVTRSEKGMSLMMRGQTAVHISTRAQEVFDVTGAGDTVVATLGASLAAGLPLTQAMNLSNVAVSFDELRQALQPQTGEHAVYNEDSLHQRIQQARAAGKRVIMTNGCFDILHPGHIDYLEKARALGDVLFVAVNDDDSVRRLKGAGRPVNPLSTRLRMLSALACVNGVVAFSEDTPERLYCHVLPNVLVKGGDYTSDQVAGGDCVTTAGGEVVILDFLAGHSTTSLIEKIQHA